MSERKYELTRESMIFNGYVLRRIRALKDFGDIKAGTIGGWISKESNLDNEGACWVYDDAKVYGDARVYDDAKIYGRAEVYGDAKVYGPAKVYGDAEVYGDAKVCGGAEVHGEAIIRGGA